VNSARRLEQSIRQSGFAMIDVRDDAEVTGELDRHWSGTIRVGRRMVNRLGGPKCHCRYPPSVYYTYKEATKTLAALAEI
jgi:hypothetical protein